MEEQTINSQEELEAIQNNLASSDAFKKLGLNQIVGVLGVSTQQEAERLRLEAKSSKGAICACCGQKVKLYKFSLTANMVLALRIMFDYYNSKYPNTDSENLPYNSLDSIFENIEIDQRKKLLSNFTRLKYWGLIAPMPTRPDKIVYKRGFFTITTNGVKFALLEAGLPKDVFVYNDSVDGHSNQFVTLDEVLAEVGINYNEIYGKIN